MVEKIEKFHEFYEEYKKLTFLDLEELISNAEDIEEKLFYNMLLQHSMDINFKEMMKKGEI